MRECKSLQAPQPPVGVEDRGPVLFGKGFEWDLSSHAPARGPPATQGPFFAAGPATVHREVRIFARLLLVEEARKDRCVASGGHAPGVVESDVARPALRQQPLPSTLECHRRILPPPGVDPANRTMPEWPRTRRSDHRDQHRPPLHGLRQPPHPRRPRGRRRGAALARSERRQVPPDLRTRLTDKSSMTTLQLLPLHLLT